MHKPHKYTNHLIHESSPYLLQHAHNPVNWYPWGKEALDKAQKENKLLLISIGYSACHWCHVMERESFENEEIAQVMNTHFVCIKVDREERPDLDHVYMNAVQLIAGQGGWPLNCFALPDGKPVYGGTYFSPGPWKDILLNLAKGYQVDAGRFEKYAMDLKKGVISLNKIDQVDHADEFTPEELQVIFSKISQHFDTDNGGSRGAPKFPLPVNYFSFMRYSYHSGNHEIVQQVMLTLDKMAKGGIYDHLGGGFARYAVDRQWLVPHFEKMLYDNAQLVSLYVEAYRLKPDPEYKKIVYETLHFIERELTSPEGGFYSSIDADSDGVEGKYYVWDKNEIEALLPEQSAIFCEYFDVSENGNWQGKNILNRKNQELQIAKKYHLSIEELERIIQQSKKILFRSRLQRNKPGLDDKVLTSWNALMLKAYADAYKVFDENHFLECAVKNYSFIEKNLMNDDFSLYRNYKNNHSTINAFLEDYALLADALITLYQATLNEYYLITALRIIEYTLQNFYDDQSGMFFFTSAKDPKLIARTKEFLDHVIPSSNAVMAQNLFKTGHYFARGEFIERSRQMLRNMKNQIIKNPVYYGLWIDLMTQFIHQPYEVCIVGSNPNESKKPFFQKYLPHILLAGGQGKSEIPILANRSFAGETTIYVCRDRVCQQPVQSFAEAMKQIEK
ncbi:MAG: thioredoxin domain-containing protein [Bacteroidales bacterium]|jgi:uncharacterized protein YyaL (SSP411 family)|nr:thioredoxin domain-containing protein [Bacteroidales bacterium]